MKQPPTPFRPSAVMHATLGGLLVCACLLDGGAATAAEPSPQFNQPLTLVQLTDLTLSNNPSTKLAWASIRSSEAGVELARAGYWPQLTLDYSVNRAKPLAGGSPTPAETTTGPSISLSYLLWDFGTRSGGADAAKFSLTAAHLSADQTVQDLILQVEQNYYQVLELQALVEADQESVKDASALLDAAQQRRASGLATIGDVYQAQAAEATAALALQQTQGQLAVARGQLAVTAGYGVDTSLPLAPWAEKLVVQLPSQSVQQLLDEARDSRPEILASKAQQQAAVATLEATQGRGWPTLGLDATAARTHTLIAAQGATRGSIPPPAVTMRA
ncbi:MAG TPA: TolC family protein [Gammaproteobacteria bacterium]|nr:TolC family protein [Gammaproteobacteria bacterium]